MINYLNFKDNKARRFFVKKEIFRLGLHSCLLDTRFSFKTRFVLKSKLENKVLRLFGNNISKIRRRCVETGRSRFIISYTKLSRAQFKRKASLGFLSGLKKR